MKYILPFLLSLVIPGLGQIIVKKVLKGIFMVALLALAFLLLEGFYLYVTAGVILIWSLVDLFFIIKNRDGNAAALKGIGFTFILLFLIIPVFFVIGYSTISSGLGISENVYFNEKNTINEMDEITGGLERYYSRNNSYPEDYIKFASAKPVRKNWITDYWGNEYKYILIEKDKYQIISSGEDMKFDTDDDIIKGNF
ncbi:hypothetical protein [Marinigracilibium pacificum]|uniref:Type II secretion system protein GspG C-terminal domain-containing protein n=1 Tax=Marinigracilibium pacificum TaxID=2729599 RepID=A0A848J5Y6_9BACT|nr:hypothetical protein [Marinigracilibium pacificum]NMM49930.1 hypothetical protein [Marinigracilibium pacificum]